MTVMEDYIRVLLYSYYTTITGWGGPPKVYKLRGKFWWMHCNAPEQTNNLFEPLGPGDVHNWTLVRLS